MTVTWAAGGGQGYFAVLWLEIFNEVVKHSPHEFTIDFCRLEFDTNPLYGVMVQRVNMSPLFANKLIRALSDNLTMYARSTPDGMTIDGGTDE